MLEGATRNGALVQADHASWAGYRIQPRDFRLGTRQSERTCLSLDATQSMLSSMPSRSRSAAEVMDPAVYAQELDVCVRAQGFQTN